MSITLYHNPRYSKSRQTLELLNREGIEPEIIEYLRTPPDTQQLEQILTLLGLEPRQLMRSNKAEYKDNNLDDPALSRALGKRLAQTTAKLARGSHEGGRQS